ncbi:FUSC family membrane protein [Salegentibacter chungangensis]|uniref:FUSC family membrane protein n=1 Tax=Salegentibacter chungangensis TaxID=1335724 RepID=A0ABW3NSE6_9FLAO
MQYYIRKYKEEFFRYLRSTDFSKALVLTTAIAIPVWIFSELGNFEVGTAIAMGCLLSSPSDVSGSLKHKIYGVLFAAALGGVSMILAGYAAFSLWFLIPVIGILVFGISYLSVFGFRASLVTFSGLLAIVLSFAGLSSTIEIWQKGLLIMLGGAWYLGLSLVWYFIYPSHQAEQLLAQCMELTGKYLKIRSKILYRVVDRDELQKQLFQLQTELNAQHESLRAVLISPGKNSANSNYLRKRLLVLIELIDMLELAMANPVDYSKMDEFLKLKSEEIKVFSDLTFYMGQELEKMGLAIDKKSKLSALELDRFLSRAQNSLDKLIESSKNEDQEIILFLKNLLDYQEKQIQKINGIYRLLTNIETNKKMFVSTKEASRFITPQDYDLNILSDNFHFNSPVFRHALRLALVVLIGFAIGSIFSFQNAYWILLTIVVIMRPNYGLTKQRIKQRIIGTLIGGGIAIGIVYITRNPVLYAILGLGSLTLAFSLIQRNYRTAAIFITLSIVFIYALLQPDVLEVIKFRVIDTLVGAGLAGLGNILLWPAWEAQGIKEVIKSSIAANRKYLKEIDQFYHQKGELPTSYKLARKKAFLEMGNLSGSFQRMKLEPKSRQKEASELYELVGLNQTFLSALASLGTYIRNHKTTKASENFEAFTERITEHLENAEKILGDETIPDEAGMDKTIKASKALEKTYKKLVLKRQAALKNGENLIDNDTELRLQEAQLVKSQLQWLLDISEDLERIISQVKFR